MLKKFKQIAKNLLAISFIRSAYVRVNRLILELFAANRALATLYSIPGFLTFNREQFAVLRARRNYYRNLSRNRYTHVELRRNVHRLEKGIIMQPRRPVFATDYIGETVEFYRRAVLQCNASPDTMDAGEMEWAHDVLREYFSIVRAGNPKVDRAREHFGALLEIYEPQSKDKKAPYSKRDAAKATVSYDDLLRLAQQRRSVRWFKQKQVPQSLIDKAILVGRQAPTACNRLPYELRVFTESDMVKKVAGIPFGAAGYGHQIPAIVVVTGKLDSYFSPRDRHAIYIDASLASMSFIFALETLGLSSSVINWPDFEPLERKMQRTLGLDTSERVVMLIAVGYADPKGGIPYSQKKSLKALRRYNELA